MCSLLLALFGGLQPRLFDTVPNKSNDWLHSHPRKLSIVVVAKFHLVIIAPIIKMPSWVLWVRGMHCWPCLWGNWAVHRSFPAATLWCRMSLNGSATTEGGLRFVSYQYQQILALSACVNGSVLTGKYTCSASQSQTYVSSSSHSKFQ